MRFTFKTKKRKERVPMSKKRYSRGEVSAYESGKGYAVATQKKGIKFTHSKLKAAFAKGYKRGLAMLRHSASKYPNLKRKRKKKTK
ncbi:MAG: hypothetical protein E7677_03270 [Ruminococcaceae bacterium]|nr:hypothetical protein [Oscillospiraceae bacterium]